MKIILFGGSFNPPHLGHQQMVEAVLEANLADEVWYLPVGVHDFAKQIASAPDRLAMLELVLAATKDQLRSRVRLEDCELRRSGVSHSADTLDYLAARYPQHQFSFLLGSDNLPKFHLWEDQHGRDFHYLLSRYQVYVYPRQGFPFDPLYENMQPLANVPAVDISSTQVRTALQQVDTKDQELSQLLTPQVIKYLRENKLYGQS